jgi:hypothetical protein
VIISTTSGSKNPLSASGAELLVRTLDAIEDGLETLAGFRKTHHLHQRRPTRRTTA